MSSFYNTLLPAPEMAIYSLPMCPSRFYIPPPMEVSGFCSKAMECPYDINKRRMSPDSTTNGMCSEEPTSNHKNKRPFKNLPKNSLELALKYASTPESLSSGMGTTSALAYAHYREKCLSQIKPTKHELNNNMRRILNSKTDDPEYLEKRRKNNEAAKKSRESRKAKEDELAIRVSFLEQENLTLRVKLAEMEKEKTMWQSMFYHR